nr:YihY/virulence factor BrkB family protein [Chloroflexia bacterium]
TALFGMLFRVVPNAGQRVDDIVPGAVTIAVLFVLMTQVFPLYLRLVQGFNRIGSAFAFLSLLLIWFYLLAHLLLFGAYINATYQPYRRGRVAQRGRRRRPAKDSVLRTED